MQTEQIVMERSKARELWRDYRKHLHWSTPIDREVMHAYQAIAQGRLVIKALESIRAAGLGEDKLPRLAVASATARQCWLARNSDGSATFCDTEDALWRANQTLRRIEFAPGSFPGINTSRFHPRAIAPMIPVNLRPKRGLANYHLLWEAEWEMVAPVDPMLLRRVGKGDLWVVCAAWDLTEIERAALSARVRA